MINVAMDATMLSTLMSCPRKAQLRFDKNIVDARGKSNSLECGSLAHCILEFYNKARIEGLNRNDAIDIGYAAGHEYVIGYTENNKYITDESEQGMQNTPEESGKDAYGKEKIGWKYVFGTMQEYFDYYRNDSFTIIGAEEVRREIIYESDDIRILWKAKFDCIMDTPHGFMSADYKTMGQRRPIMDLNVQFMGQCNLLKSRNIMIDKIGWQKSLKTHEKFERAIVSYSADRLAEFVNDIVPYYARMLAAYNESEVFPPNFTNCENKYGQCEYVKICQQDRNMRDEVMEIEYMKGKVWDI